MLHPPFHSHPHYLLHSTLTTISSYDLHSSIVYIYKPNVIYCWRCIRKQALALYVSSAIKFKFIKKMSSLQIYYYMQTNVPMSLLNVTIKNQSPPF